MNYTKDKNGNLVLTFESPINVDNGYINIPQGTKTSDMTLYIHDNEKAEIEWDVNGGEFIENIGLWFENKTLVDYDGVFELPIEAVKLIRKAGFRVPKDFLS